MRLAILPARGGSKRIPRKNIRPFCGRPMIAWPLAAAGESELFDRIVVSTDDAEIADVAAGMGGEAPFLRPAALSDDYTGTIDVVAHATRWALDRGWTVEAVCCIYPTAPMIAVADIVEGGRLLESGGWDFVFTATEYPSPIFRAFRQTEAGGVEMFFPEHFATRSQELPRALHDAAQFYWGRPEAWLRAETLFGPRSRPLIVPRWRVQDIDTPDDWHRAEAMFRALDGDGA